MPAPAHLGYVVELRRRVTNLEGELEGKERLKQTLPRSTDEKARLSTKIENMRSTTIQFQTESEAKFMVVDVHDWVNL